MLDPSPTRVSILKQIAEALMEADDPLTPSATYDSESESLTLTFSNVPGIVSQWDVKIERTY